MITPEYLSEIVSKIESQMSDVNYEIIAKIIERLQLSIEKYGEAKIITSSMKNIIQLEASGLIYADIEQIIERAMPKLDKQVRTAFTSAIPQMQAFDGFEYKDREVRTSQQAVSINTAINNGTEPSQEDLKPNVEEMSTETKKVVESAFRRTKGEMRNLTRTTAGDAQRQFNELLDRTMLKIQQGQSMNTALIEAIDEAKGIGAKITYPSGHSDYIEVALARAVRTGINQANSDMVLSKCGELGIGYVKVSSHMGARVTKNNDYTNHSWWQGKVYKLNWNDAALQKFKVDGVDYSDKDKPKNDTRKKNRKRGTSGKYVNSFQDFSVCGYGKIEGLCGINCRHTMSMFFPNLMDATLDKIDEDKNRKRYELEQKQRGIERAIRQTKRDIAKWKNVDSADKQLQDSQDKLARQMRHYTEFCRNNGLPQREWSTKTSSYKNVYYNQSDDVIMYKKMMMEREKVYDRDLKNSLPIKGKPNSITDKLSDDGKTIQRRVYGADGMAKIEYDTTAHGLEHRHPTIGHKHIFDYSKKNPHGKPLPLTEIELMNNSDIYKRGVNYFD